MKAVVWHDVGKVTIDDVPNPTIQAFDRRDPGWTKVTLEIA